MANRATSRVALAAVAAVAIIVQAVPFAFLCVHRVAFAPARPTRAAARQVRVRRRAEEDFWKVLGVPPGTSVKEVKRAYRRRAKEEHPDVDKSPGALQRWQRLSAAYGKLIDPEYRRRWSDEEARRTAREQEFRRSAASTGARTSTQRPSERNDRPPPSSGFPRATEAKKWAAAGWDAFQDILQRADGLRRPRAGYSGTAASREFQASQIDLEKAQQKLKKLSSDEQYYLSLTETGLAFKDLN